MPDGSSRQYGLSNFRSTSFMQTRRRPARKSWERSMALEILKPGLSPTGQDLGPLGYYHLGIPESGGMDKSSLAAANLLVGNPEGAAVLEAVFLGPELEFTDDAMVAVAGAELPPRLDGVPRDTWASFKVKRGHKLSFDYLKNGARAYV